ncbi:MAG: RNA degradosome polyphosphate kinase [Defluviitaleaceae bacterium]|nr:RNA degradosome polyphosphate kinase [Defluviitaleaceae bacterium]
MTPTHYINRELSWLEFNERVLEEAMDKTNPLLERLKFLAITASNLDEFFMVRVSSLWDMDGKSPSLKDPAGMTIKAQLAAISAKARDMTGRQCSCLTRSILPALAKEGVSFLRYDELNPWQAEAMARYFKSTVYPILTPMAIDQSRPFPLLNNRALHVIAELSDNGGGDGDGERLFAVMQIPTVIPRIIPLPSDQAGPGPGQRQFTFLEELAVNHIRELFTGYNVLNTALFRIIRNSDLMIDEEDAEDIMDEIERSIKRRKWGDPVKLEIEKKMAKSSRRFLEKSLDLDDDDIYEITGPMDHTVWMGFTSLEGADALRNRPLPPQPAVDFLHKDDMFAVIREKDILVHHPYESFDCVVNFVRQAAADPQTLAIKQTLYRVSGDSPIVSALIAAAENGKQVTVLVELKARFDEENNIIWAKKLEKSGCHVVYGLVGLKTHCKICLVVRREDDGIRRYLHLGTGNYNDSTARIYTDIGYFTCKETFGQDISALFNVLTGYSVVTSWNKISVAPVSLREALLYYIGNETKNALDGKDACIMAKLNSLVDVEIIDALYRASAAGVSVKLLVRGICCLRPGIEGVSENITVVSIVDRFLEHSRIYYFENGGTPKIYLSSADWMPRNLDRRVEVAFPIEDAALRERIVDILDISFSDTDKLRALRPDGSYERVDRRGKEHNRSQMKFWEMAAEGVRLAEEEFEKAEVFRPIEAATNANEDYGG